MRRPVSASRPSLIVPVGTTPPPVTKDLAAYLLRRGCARELHLLLERQALDHPDDLEVARSLVLLERHLGARPRRASGPCTV